MAFGNGPTVTLRISLNHHPAMVTAKVPSILSEGGVLPPGNGDDDQHHRPRWVDGVLMQLGCVNLVFFSTSCLAPWRSAWIGYLPKFNSHIS